MNNKPKLEKKIAILCNGSSEIITDRTELVSYLHELGIQPYIAGVNTEKVNSYYSEENALYISISASRSNTNPLKEIASIFSVAKKMKTTQIDAVIIYGVKNHGAMAIGSWLGGVKKIMCVVNGSGNLFRVAGIKGNLLRAIAYPTLRFAYRLSKSICFQNEDDRILFIKKHLVRKNADVFVTGGSGVNLEVFPNSPLPDNNCFLFLARITPTKGISEFIDAARIVRERFPNAIFDIVGPLDNTIENGKNSKLDKAIQDNIVSYHGPTTKVPDWMVKCRFFVYPSYYPEGVPRCAMQAIACGRPIITCDTPGCKETVVDGKNGFMIHSRDPIALSEKMIWMIEHPHEVEQMAKESRKLAESKFDVNKINTVIIDKLIG